MKLALRPRLLPPALEWRHTRVFAIGGLGLTLSAALTALAHANPIVSLSFAAGAALSFAGGYRGRADHLERLALALMADREKARRLEVIGLATAGFAHELKNALTVLKGFSELAKRSEDELAKERITAVDAQAGRLIGELKNFLVLARNERQQTQRPLGEVVREVVLLLAPLAQLRDLTFESTVPDGLDAPVQDPALRRALLNLGLNAMQAARSRVRLTVGQDTAGITLTVEDDGAGVAPELRSLLFTPFASGRADGTGLGLTQVREAATNEGGFVEFEPALPTGARFVVRLPATAAPPTLAPPVG
jgi:signal transduction histidine kinase